MTLGAVTVLATAAILDLRTRHIPNAYWIGATMALVPFTIQQGPLWAYVASVIITTALCVLLHALHVFGGADAKGVIFLALVIHPTAYYAPWAGRTHVVLDTLIVALLLTEIIRRVLRVKSMPFFVVYAPIVAVTLYWYPILWWPIAWLGLS